MSAAQPAVGDVFEYRNGSARGKRVRLIRKFDDARSWEVRFSTQTIAHPNSPRMVGQTSSIQAIRLTTSQFAFVAKEATA